MPVEFFVVTGDTRQRVGVSSPPLSPVPVNRRRSAELSGFPRAQESGIDRRMLTYEPSGISTPATVASMEDKDLYSGLIRLPVLHHACEGKLFGLDIIEELTRHPYRMSSGTI